MLKRKSLKRKSLKRKYLKGGNKINCDLIFIDNYFEDNKKDIGDYYENIFTTINPIKDDDTRKAFIKTLRKTTGHIDPNYFKFRENKYKKEICKILNSYMERHEDIIFDVDYVDKIYNKLDKLRFVDYDIELLKNNDSQLLQIINEL